MAATFAEWLRWPDREVVVLAELSPSLELTGWSAVGGATPNVYSVSLPRAIATDVVAGGLTRRCTGVKQNATSLTERASVSAVNGNAGSWWWDEANDTLYVHTTTGSDPDLFTVMQAIVTFYVATKGVVLNRTDGNADTGLYYWPWLDGTLPSIEREVEDLFFGQKNLEAGAITVLNGHGVWDTLVAPDGSYHWKNKKVAFFVGGSYNGQALARSQYTAITTMLIEDVSADETRVTFELKPQARRLTVEIPPTPFFADDYPNLGEGVEGTRKPIGYGRAITAPPLTDTSSHGVYTVADAAYQTLFAVHRVWAVDKATGDKTLLALTTDYTVNLTACTVTVVNATYAWGTYLLHVDATGKPDGSGSYLQTFGSIVMDMLETFAGIDATDIDASAFAACDVLAPDELAVWITQSRSLASVLSTSEPGFASLERSVMGTVQETLAGKFTAWIWDPGYDASTVVELQKSDFAYFSPQPKLETVVAGVRVHYAANLATGAWSQRSASDSAVTYTEETVDTLNVYTFLRSSPAALALAQRMQLISSGVSTEIDFALRRPLLAEHVAGDKVLVTFDRAPAAAGEYAHRAFELVKLGKSFAPTVAIVGRLGDLRGIGDRIAHVTADTMTDWTATGPADRSGWGYVSDDDGYTDPSDLSTQNARVVW